MKDLENLNRSETVTLISDPSFVLAVYDVLALIFSVRLCPPVVGYRMVQNGEMLAPKTQ